MRKFSWEIVLAGFFLVAAAIFLLEKGEDNNNQAKETAFAASQEEKKAVHIINLEGIEQLSDLERLQELDNASALEGLKALATILPTEQRDEFLTEIDHAIAELNNSDIDVNFDLDDKLVIVRKQFSGESAVWSESSPGVFTYFREFEASNLSNATLDLPFGSIKVVGSESETGKITLQASGKIDSESQLNEDFITSFSVNSSSVEISFEAKEESKNHNIQLQATLFIPENIALQTATDGGHIEITNVLGDQTHETDGGHITLTKVGKVTAETDGGHITLKGGSGNFVLETDGGHITAERITGSGVMETDGGNIRITEVFGEVTAETDGGNVLVKQSSIQDRMVLETSAGNISIAGPSSLQATIDFNSSNGVSMSGFNFTGEKTAKKAAGSINGGGGSSPTIYASTGNGKVTLKAND